MIATLAIALTLSLSACASAARSAQATWGDPGTAAKPYLTLDHDGTLTGSDGCNRLRGSWKQSGATVTFDALASTLMACNGVDTWLSRAATARVSGSTLTVFDGSHHRIGTLAQHGS
jgi:heat shock protein HslJ